MESFLREKVKAKLLRSNGNVFATINAAPSRVTKYAFAQHPDTGKRLNVSFSFTLTSARAIGMASYCYAVYC